MREIRLAKLDKTRPVLVLTRTTALATMTKVTVAPITSTIKGLASEVPLDERNGLDHACAAALDNTTTLPVTDLGHAIGFLLPRQERVLSQAVTMAFDLDAEPYD